MRASLSGGGVCFARDDAWGHASHAGQRALPGNGHEAMAGLTYVIGIASGGPEPAINDRSTRDTIGRSKVHFARSRDGRPMIFFLAYLTLASVRPLGSSGQFHSSSAIANVTGDASDVGLSSSQREVDARHYDDGKNVPNNQDRGSHSDKLSRNDQRYANVAGSAGDSQSRAVIPAGAT
jgi:hypothetical protein